jgi:MoxR-like ATPase
MQFKGTGEHAPAQPVDLLTADRSDLRDPRYYNADPGLASAVNVALWLQMPLLVTGEPGTGKTQLAGRIAFELGLAEPLKFETKSTSVAQDLLYSFDTVGRFSAAQLSRTDPDARNLLMPHRFVRYQALGLAIIRANPRAAVAPWLPPEFPEYVSGRSVILIDEIDKAPRDFPNDLLNELDRMSFRVLEISDSEIAAPKTLRPIIIITSNSEKQLPDAFLRRCVFYHIELNPDRLETIVALRLPRLKNSRLVEDAMRFFLKLRGDSVQLSKKPSTAELLDWVDAMIGAGADAGRPLAKQSTISSDSLGALAKFRDDLPVMRAALERWCAGTL